MTVLALVADPLFLRHEPSFAHPERPERLLAVQRGIETSRLARSIVRLPARDASSEELERVHDADYLESLAQCRGRSGFLDPDTYFSGQSYAAAARAAGGSVLAVDRLHDKAADYAFLALRPPGHHARPGQAMGFCLLNHVAIAAAHARALGAKRVAIVDWDVHHGNGTEEMFYGTADVLYVSLHQAPLYPGTGLATDVGSGVGEGFTLNLPLPPGSGDAEYLVAFSQVICPVLNQYAPDFILVSAGFDAHRRDPLAQMNLSDIGYAVMTRALMDVLPAFGKGRLGFWLEGGYDLQGLTESVRAVLDTLDFPSDADEKMRVLRARPSDFPAVEAVRLIQRRYWRL